jgi:low temperature requirement protein LtrA
VSADRAPAAADAPEPEERVTPLELFFDLVFVLSITQITGFVSVHLSWAGLGKGLIVLALLWWAWAAYAWLTNSVDAESGRARVVVLAGTAGMLVVALAVPRAFDGEGLLFAVAYLVVRLLHLVLYEVATRGDTQHAAILRLAPYLAVGPLLVLVGGAVGGSAQIAIWLAALAIDYAGPRLSTTAEWRVRPAHFAERHALIVIIALGESIVAIGVGATGTRLTAGVVVAALLGVTLVSCLWWAYFDVVAVVATRRLTALHGAALNAQARDSYTYLHFPMITGIVLLALGVKQTVAHVDRVLDDVAAVCLCGGFALYLLAHVAFRLRNVHSVNRQRVVAAVVLVALLPLALHADALVALAAVTAVAVGLIAYEAIHFADARARVRRGL